MSRFKKGDRVRVSPSAPQKSGAIGIITAVSEREADASESQNFEVSFETHSHFILGKHLQYAHEPLHLFFGEVVRKWPQLSSPEIEGRQGDPMELVSLLEGTYGYSTNRAQKELDALIWEFCEKLRIAQAA